MDSKEILDLIYLKMDIHDYIIKYIDHNHNRNDTEMFCCFHKASHPTMTITKDRRKFKCWSCGAGKDIADMHMLKNKIKIKEDAIIALASILGISTDSKEIDLTERELKINQTTVKYNSLYAHAVGITRNTQKIDDYIELDYIMSQYKPKTELIEDLEDYIRLRCSNVK